MASSSVGRFSVVAVLLSVVNAQTITASFFDVGTTTCGSQNSALLPTYRVRGPRGLCLSVPGNPSTSYLTTCNAGLTGGVVAMCTDALCAVCTNTVFANEQCVTIPGTITPTTPFSRLALNCSSQAGENLLEPTDNFASITYHADAACELGMRTEFTTSSGTCNRITATASMMIECAGDAGMYRQFASGDCSEASIDTGFFYGGQCLPQPVGEPAVSVQCGIAPSPTPTPTPTPSQTPSQGGRAPSTSPTARSEISSVTGTSGAATAGMGVMTALSAMIIASMVFA